MPGHVLLLLRKDPKCTGSGRYSDFRTTYSRAFPAQGQWRLRFRFRLQRRDRPRFTRGSQIKSLLTPERQPIYSRYGIARQAGLAAPVS